MCIYADMHYVPATQDDGDLQGKGGGEANVNGCQCLAPLGAFIWRQLRFQAYEKEVRLYRRERVCALWRTLSLSLSLSLFFSLSLSLSLSCGMCNGDASTDASKTKETKETKETRETQKR